MAGYVAMRLEAGKMNYNAIMKTRLVAPLKEDIDAILALDGYVVNEDGTVVKAENIED